jgi:hypothetical protein
MFVNLNKPLSESALHDLDMGEDLPKFNPKPTSSDRKKVCADRPDSFLSGACACREGAGTG